MYIHNNLSTFTQREIAAALQIWNRAAVSLLDIRHNLISPGEALRGYRLPASAFLYTSGGKAEVLLNDTPYNMERFGLFHGGKGTGLTITPQCDWLEYYMILYKAVEPPLHKSEYLRSIEQTNPFRQQYGFAPSNPIFFSEELRKLYEKWKGPTPLNVFYGKTAFYRFVYEIYEELEQGHVHVFEPDVIAMAQRYLNEHYSEAVSIQDMCNVLGISYSHFHRSFKQQSGKSPQEYLIQTRLSAARDLLKNKSVTVREVAGYCGFQDERNFQRLFLKHTGLSPNAYRENTPLPMRGETVGNRISFPYNEQGQVSLGELKEKGATYMLKQMRSKAMVAAALSLVLLLSACSTVPANNNGNGSTPTSAVTSSVEEGTRTVSTIMGDIEVPANPVRIVESGYWRGDILALGVTPVATADFYTQGQVYDDQMEGVVVLEKWEEEDIMAMEPDIIITGGEADFEKFSKIAPTIVIPWGTPAEERLPLIAQVLGQEASAGNALIDEYNKKVEDYRAKLKSAGLLNKTITVFRNDGVVEGGLELGTEMGWGGEVVYGLFDMPTPTGVQKLRSQKETSGNISNVSFEVVPELCGDYILVNQGDLALIKTLDENPIWQSIPAVQKGNVVSVEPGKVYFPDIITSTYKLELICEGLLKLADNQ